MLRKCHHSSLKTIQTANTYIYIALEAVWFHVLPISEGGGGGMGLSTGEKKERKREEKPAGFCS